MTFANMLFPCSYAITVNGTLLNRAWITVSTTFGHPYDFSRILQYLRGTNTYILKMEKSYT